MFDQWLQPGAREPDAFSHFGVIDINEIEEPHDEAKAAICDLLRQSAVDLDFLEDVVQRLGWQKAEAIVHQRLPAQTNARRGRFGEVVGVFMLREFEGYLVPIEKAHFSITGGQSQPSTDAVLIKLRGDAISEVCFVESKLRTSRDTDAAVEGVQQLQADYEKEIPDMLTYTAARLFDRDDPLYTPFMAYMGSRDDLRELDSFRLLLFYSEDLWSERALTNLEDDSPTASPLTVHVTRLAKLRELVAEIFSRVGLIAVDD